MNALWRWAMGLGLAGAAACGGRAGLSDALQSSSTQASGGGPSTGDADASLGGRAGTSADAGLDAPSGDRFLDGGIPWDALPMPEAGPVADCLTCVRTNCRDLIDRCAQDPACLLGAVCVALECHNGQNPLCPPECSEGPSGASLLGAVALACVLEQCGDSCQPRSSLEDASVGELRPVSGLGVGGLAE